MIYWLLRFMAAWEETVCGGVKQSTLSELRRLDPTLRRGS